MPRSAKNFVIVDSWYKHDYEIVSEGQLILLNLLQRYYSGLTQLPNQLNQPKPGVDISNSTLDSK